MNIRKIISDTFYMTGHTKEPVIVVEYNPRLQTTFGTASWDWFRKHYTLAINPKLWERADVINRENLIIHETCHIIDHIDTGIMSDHERHWRKLIAMCGLQPEDEVYHCVNVQGVKRRQRRVKASCNCGSITELTMTRANKVLKGYNYFCRRCRTPVKLKEKIQAWD